MNTDDRWTKPFDHFIKLHGALETPMERQTDFLTTNEDFFVCSAGPAPDVSLSTWRLEIGGEASSGASFSYEDLSGMPQKTVPAYLECAGNHRRLFQDLKGKDLYWRPGVEEVMWNMGGIGMAEWTGVPLRSLLEEAGLSADAVCVVAEGLDKGLEGAEGIRCVLPREKALDPSTLIALKMNGVPLPPDHGFPARLIVPGWVGTFSIKWLGTLQAFTQHQWVHRNTHLYVLMGENWPQEAGSPSWGGAMTEQSIKSSLALAWPAQLLAGPQRIRGYARCPSGMIEAVEWSEDGGVTWASAEITGPVMEFAWVPFAFDWDAKVGEHVLMTRARDNKGREQPDDMPFNTAGYLFNEPHPHPVTVIE